MKIGPLTIQWQRIMMIAGLAFLVFMVMDFNARLDELNRKQQRLATIGAQGTQIILTQYALQTQVAYATSDDPVEAWAREQARMAQTGDQPIVPMPGPGATPVVQPTPSPVPTPFTKWDVWMEMIFGH
jgi:hypothetical protein